MDERCVFCGADSPGGIVCPNCRDKLNDLPEDKRRVIEEIAENEQAREDLWAAVADVVAQVAEATAAVVSLLRRFCEKVLPVDKARALYGLDPIDDEAGVVGENRCVCCGEIVPEGRMVCPICESGATARED